MATRDELRNDKQITEEKKAQTAEMREQNRLANEGQTVASQLQDSLKKQMDLRFDSNKLEAKLAEDAAKHLTIIKAKGKSGDSLSKSYKDQLDLNNKIRSGSLKQGQLSKIIAEAAQKEKEAREKGHPYVADGYKGLIKMAEGQKKLNANKMFEEKLTENLDKLTGGMASKAKDFAGKLKEAPMGALKAGAAGLAVIIGTTLIKALTAFSAKIDEVGKTFGFITNQNEDFRNDLILAGNNAAMIGKNLSDVLSVTSALSSEFGITLQDAGDLSNKILDTAVATGLSNEEATKLFGTFMQIGNLTAKQAEDLIENTAQLAAQKGVAPTAVLQDMAGSAEEIAKFTKDGGINIAEAAIQARQMGISLSTTAKIAEGLLDFESSITNELEASIMIGKQLNFQRARQLALEGDIAGATKNIVDQVGSEAEFNKLNVLQRESLAKSIGVSVNEMAKLVKGSKELTLSGALAGESFGDLVGQDSLSTLTQITNAVKSIGATLLDNFGEPLSRMLKQFTGPDGLQNIKIQLVAVANVFIDIVRAVQDFFNIFRRASREFTLMSRLQVGSGGNIQKVNDFKAGPGQITHLLGPKGVASLNPRDSVMGTTNQINDFQQFPAGTLPGNGMDAETFGRAVAANLSLKTGVTTGNMEIILDNTQSPLAGSSLST